jgi:hypothetical protein
MRGSSRAARLALGCLYGEISSPGCRLILSAHLGAVKPAPQALLLALSFEGPGSYDRLPLEEQIRMTASHPSYQSFPFWALTECYHYGTLFRVIATGKFESARAHPRPSDVHPPTVSWHLTPLESADPKKEGGGGVLLTRLRVQFPFRVWHRQTKPDIRAFHRGASE